MKISIICPYSPKRNSITSFSISLKKALTSIKGYEVKIVGIIKEENTDERYNTDVSIRKNALFDYINASDKINEWSDIVVLQHSHQAYGGENGIFILSLLSRLKKPLIASFHQLSQQPLFLEKKQVETIGQLASSVVAFSNQAMEVLEHIYKVSNEKIIKIDYGVDDYKLPDRETLRQELGFSNEKVVFSYGYLNREKSIQSIINALPTVAIRHRDVRFIYIGQTDQKTLDSEGESYRFELNLFVQKSGMAKQIDIIDKYIDDAEIQKYLVACDLFITPYIGNSHIQSSVLTQGMASGAAIISTPFWHSNEVLSDDRGEFVSETSIEMMAEKISGLLSDNRKLDQLRQSASDFGKHFKWSKLTSKYHNVFQSCKDTYQPTAKKQNEVLLIPHEELDYLNKLTDTTGMIQNATSAIPFLKDGYRIEDNALALMLYVRKYRVFKNKESFDKINLFLSFIQYMQKEDGEFYPSLSYDRQKTKKESSEAAFGLTLWALGDLMANSPNSTYLQIAKDLFFNSAHVIPLVNGLQGMSNVLIGISKYLEVSKGDELMSNYADKIVKQMVVKFTEESAEEWQWFESSITQEKVIACLSLIYAADVLKSKKTMELALSCLEFVESKIFNQGFFIPIGRASKLTKVSKKEEFDQYSIDMLPMVLMYEKLYQITRDDAYMTKMKLALMWYLGDNSLRKSLFDHHDGGCYQSLTKKGVSHQEGADSSLAFWISYYSYMSSYCEGLLV